MGGHTAGEVASTTARDFIFNHIEGLISPDMTIPEVQCLFVDLARQTSEALDLKSDLNPQYIGMGTTMSLVKIHQDEEGKFAVVLNIGDSRVYKLSKDGTLEQISSDDNLLSEENDISPEEKKIMTKHLDEAKNLEDLSEEEELFFRKRQVISQCLPKVKHYFPSKTKVNMGDKILITSDGIHDNLTYTEIQETLTGSGSDEDLARELVQRAIKRSHEKTMRSKKDDMTAMVISLAE